MELHPNLMSKLSFPRILPLSHESTLNQHWEQTLLPFWRQLNHGQFNGVAGVPIHYSCHVVPGARYAWVISSGRIETAIKYTELIYELTQAGYSVFIMDHRGQGRSGRMLPDAQLGYVATFDDYQQDLITFVRDVVKPTGHHHHMLLAHSMGAAIAAATFTLERWRDWHRFFHAAVLCSPMFGIYTGKVPTLLAEKAALLYCSLVRYLAPQEHRYFPSQLAYHDKPFHHNELTSSLARYQILRQCYQTEPQLQLGGVSCHWLQQAIRAMQALQEHAQRCQTPLLLLQAGADSVVANPAQQRWFDALPTELPKAIKPIKQAKHELLMEQDAVRSQVITEINTFLNQLDYAPPK